LKTLDGGRLQIPHELVFDLNSWNLPIFKHPEKIRQGQEIGKDNKLLDLDCRIGTREVKDVVKSLGEGLTHCFGQVVMYLKGAHQEV
jgi:hypothetical protein